MLWLFSMGSFRLVHHVTSNNRRIETEKMNLRLDLVCTESRQAVSVGDAVGDHHANACDT